MFSASFNMDIAHALTNRVDQNVIHEADNRAAVGLISGEYHYNFMGLAGAFTHVRSGKLRGIAVSNAKRLSNAPDIPAMNEVLPGFEVVGWYGVAAPAKLPKPGISGKRGWCRAPTAQTSAFMAMPPRAFRSVVAT